MDLERDSSGLELISKAGAVLGILEQHGEASAADLAAALGEPLSSVYRLLQSLTATGWVDRGSRRGAYRLGLSLMTDRWPRRRSSRHSGSVAALVA